MQHTLVALTGMLLIFSLLCMFNLYKDLDCDNQNIVKIPHSFSAAHSRPLQSSHSLTKKEEYFLVILILSSSFNVKQRNILRNTWLKFCSNINVKYYFLLGTKFLTQSDKAIIYNEHYQFNDLIILESVEDAYDKLSSKLLNGFVWVSENIRSKYILKCDDDSFVNVKELLEILKEYEGDSNQLYLGFFNGRATVQKHGKWKEQNWVLCNYYLPYALGGGYVLSEELVNFIARNANDLQLFLSEDVSVGVWLAGKANLKRVHSTRFNTEYKSRGCSNSFVISHKHSETELKELFSNLKNTGKMCKNEFQTMWSYNYNWSVPPSKCCLRTNALP